MLLDLAKTMRTQPTDAEHRLWQHLRAKRLLGFKFRRQQPLGNYIADFVCFEPRTIVELDGGQHNGQSKDLVRDAWLTSQGFKVLRFWNNEVFENLEGVLERVLAQLQKPSPSPLPLSRKGRGNIASFASLPLYEGGIEGQGDASQSSNQPGLKPS